MAQHERRSLKELLIGRPLRNRELQTERLGILSGLSVLSPDALSSVAYGTEEILTVLFGISAAALWFSLPIALAIVAMLAVLVVSYRQVIAAYPSGGGAYLVGRDSLGTLPSLVAGASLLVDYTLTVAVSVTAGADAIISAFPPLAPQRVPLDLLLIALITVINLRGTRESATVLAGPTYAFVLLMLALVGVGLWHGGLAGLAAHHALQPRALGGISLFLLLRAFSSGSSALTGLEAISNGVPLFRDPAVRRAQQGMALLGLLLGTMFLGTTVLAFAYGVMPQADNTVLSQVAAHVFGRGPLYFLLAFTTTAILALAANTSFAGFPQLAHLMAADKFMPHLFHTRGDRLVFTNGILVVAALAGLLVVIFGGSTDRLIPLYAIGVYVGFTISQVGLVVRRRREGQARGHALPGDAAKSLINGTGAAMTAVVVVVFTVTKFAEGAWIVLIVIPLLVLWFRRVHAHYAATAEELRLPSWDFHPAPQANIVIVPVSTITRVVAYTIGYARTISPNVLALHVSSDPAESEKLVRRWSEWNPGVRLVSIESQYRSVVQPVLRYIDLIQAQTEGAMVTVLIPEFVVGKWWHGLLHNQMGLLLQARLVSRRDVVIAMVPYRLSGR
ncbi:MAG TPA: APC family permease [Bacillota bacterium]|nr:APC family permease [Bacillota bacterium]